MSRHLQVLIAETAEARFRQMAALLNAAARQPVACTWAPTPAAAREAILSDRADVSLLAHPLGTHDSIELLSEATRQRCTSPIIVVASEESAALDEAAMRAGAADFIVRREVTGPLLERSVRYAVERGEMLRALHLMASQDPITGLLNRREFDRALRDEVGRAVRYGRQLMLAVVDVDRFKRVNDNLGHPVGDMVLRRIAAILTAGVGSGDTPARYGGDEFALLLPETTAAGAYRVAERIRLEVGADPCRIHVAGRAIELPVTVSIGLAELGTSGSTDADLLLAADVALLAAKRTGRNRTVVSHTPPAWTVSPDGLPSVLDMAIPAKTLGRPVGKIARSNASDELQQSRQTARASGRPAWRGHGE